MAASNAKPPLQRKRNRKRKRRVASSDSSSDSDSSSNFDHAPSPPRARVPVDEQPRDSSLSSSSDSSSSESDSETAPSSKKPSLQTVPGRPPLSNDARSRASPTTSPPADVPLFRASQQHLALNLDERSEPTLRERFRKLWMASVADAFQSDLVELQKEPNMTSSRLALLIDSLASGAEVFSSATHPGTDGSINEMEVVLENAERTG